MSNVNELTADEIVILNDLGNIWDKFLELPIQHPNHQQEFLRYIHEAQRMVMSRPIARQMEWVKDNE